MPVLTGPLLSPAELDALGRLQLRLRRRVVAGGVGGHRARGHGTSLDFDDYRPYQPGDDPRRVDHHAYRRLGRLLVKLYEAEDDTGLQVVVDASASMGFGSKPAAACRVAAAIAVVAAHGGDRVRLVVADQRVADQRVTLGRWRRGRQAVAAILADLAAVHARLAVPPEPPQPRVADDPDPLLSALRQALPHSRRGPVVLISDLLLPAHGEVLATLAAATSGAACLHLLDGEDLDPVVTDDPRLIDVDYGTVINGAATDAARRRFAAARDAWLDGVTGQARSADIALRRQVGPLDSAGLLRLLPAIGVLR